MKYLRFASIDIGSNAIRLLFSYVFETKTGPVFRKALLVRVPIRLGADSFTHGYISPENINKLVDSMTSFKYLMKAHGVISYQAYATSAMREASNSVHIIDRIYEETGIPVKIISGEEEANEIASRFLAHDLNMVGPVLYVDVGGGSTELTLVEGNEKIGQHSFDVGTIRLLHHTVEPGIWKELKTWLKEHHLNSSKIQIIGSGGNINKIFKMKRKKVGDNFITPASLKAAYVELLELSYEDRIVKYYLNPDRADVIIPACEIFLNITDFTKTKKIYVPKVGLSDGIIRSLYREHKVMVNG
jgi:exopolyphosphatase/guanosine-5'-triphosphate,3'-diphosphate pyrophosphatase